jgi:hypothetical protein
MQCLKWSISPTNKLLFLFFAQHTIDSLHCYVTHTLKVARKRGNNLLLNDWIQLNARPNPRPNLRPNLRLPSQWWVKYSKKAPGFFLKILNQILKNDIINIPNDIWFERKVANILQKIKHRIHVEYKWSKWKWQLSVVFYNINYLTIDFHQLKR